MIFDLFAVRVPSVEEVLLLCRVSSGRLTRVCRVWLSALCLIM